MPNNLKFDLPKNQSNIIKVIGIGGGGSNAVNHMYKEGITGVDFIVCNTDSQALDISPIPTKIQLGASLTEGRGAGSIPEKGKNAALENLDELRAILDHNTKMVFITAGMGGGTGTGGAPVVAALAKEMGILTVGIVTIPFLFEGRKRKQQADNGIQELRNNVDTLLVICNDKLRELYGDLTLSRAFGKADDILTVAAKGIAEIITVPGYINVDFEDINTVMRDSGVAIMGSGSAEGPERATLAIREALESPLLNDSDIYGAENILLYITSGDEEVSMDEVSEITDYIQKQAGMEADIIWGNGNDPHLGNRLNITLVATGFDKKERKRKQAEPEKVVVGALGSPNPPAAEPEILVEPTVDEVEEVHLLSPETPAIMMHSLLEDEPPVFQDIKARPDYMPLIPDEQESEIELLLRETVQPQMERREISRKPELTEVSEEEKLHEEIRRVIRPEAKTSTEESGSPERNGNEGRSMDRIKKLKDLSLKLRSINDINELEKQPAYVRRNIELNEPPHSSESQISRFSLSENGNDKNGSELRSNNSYLHDNVD
jgi:cell division protein FtsZ